MSSASFHRHPIRFTQVLHRQVLSRYGQAPAFVNIAIRAALGQALAFMLVVMVTMTPAAAEPPLRLLVFGDSLTAGYGLPPDQSFPVQLEAALRAANHDVAVINAGVSGDTSAGGLARLDWLLEGVPGGGADAAIVALGANDALRGLDPQSTMENLSAILTRFAEEGIPVLLAGMLAPPNLGLEYAENFAAIYPRLADEHDVLLYPFFLDGVAGNRKLNQADGIHPTRGGVAVMVKNILPRVEALLEQTRQAESLTQ